MHNKDFYILVTIKSAVDFKKTYMYLMQEILYL